jgi:hypothetical protein
MICDWLQRLKKTSAKVGTINDCCYLLKAIQICAMCFAARGLAIKDALLLRKSVKLYLFVIKKRKKNGTFVLFFDTIKISAAP